MSAVIHQILLEKLNETSEVLLTIDIWSNSRNPQLEDTVSNFEIINKQIFSVTERMFKPDRCHLTVKIWSLDVYQL